MVISEARKAELIEKHRDCNVEGIDWWDCVYEHFVENMNEIGVSVDTRAERFNGKTGAHKPQIFFSGFSSQGDGACFNGEVDDWPKFLTHLGYTEPQLIEHAKTYWRLNWNQHGHYSHSGCTRFYEEFPMVEEDHPDHDFSLEVQPLTVALWWAIMSQFCTDTILEEAESTLRRHMDALYKTLEQEYDYQTSDDAVWETLEANDYFGESVTDEGEDDEHDEETQ